jgi:large subunit ribosomal protein L23
MSEERLLSVLIGPRISEKSTVVADSANQIVFDVVRDAAKHEIKLAVEKLFNVEVERVQVVNVRGKIKRFGRTPGQRSNFKKAYVRLKPGHDIDFLGSGA